jgi:F-type H+-transporting ATPase subunit b
MIELNWTLLAAGTVFLFTLWALNKLLFKPLLQVLDERRSETSDLQKWASEKHDYHEALFQEYSEKVKQERQKGYAQAEVSRREAMEARQKLIGKAKGEADVLREKARTQIEQEVEQVRQKLHKNAEEIAGVMTARVLEKT